MKKIRAIKYIGILLFIIYILAIIIAYQTEYFGNLSGLLFSIILAIVSLTLCFKGAILRSYSTLWFAISLILYAILVLIFEIRKISYVEFNYLFAFLPVLSSLLLLFLGRRAYFKVIILNLSIAIPLLLNNLLEFATWVNVAIYSASIVVGILMCRGINLGKERV